MSNNMFKYYRIPRWVRRLYKNHFNDKYTKKEVIKMYFGTIKPCCKKIDKIFEVKKDV